MKKMLASTDSHNRPPDGDGLGIKNSMKPSPRSKMNLGLLLLVALLAGVPGSRAFSVPVDRSQNVIEIFGEVDEAGHFVRNKREAGEPEVEVSPFAQVFAGKLNSSHLHLMVHWAGQGSGVLFLLARDQEMKPGASSKTFLSKDYGKSFTDVSDRFKLESDNNGDASNAIIAKFYHHPKSFCHYVFADTVNNYVFMTKDCGETITAHRLDKGANPSSIVFDENRDTIFVIHDLKSPKKTLWVTTDFGNTFNDIQVYVKTFFFHYGDDVTKLFVQRFRPGAEDKDLKTTILASTNFFQERVDTEIVYRDAKEFQVVGDFMFVTRERDQDNPGHLDLYVSRSGERFVEAVFPFSADKNLTHIDYHIIDVTDEDQIMIVVNHGPVLSNLYTSTRITPYKVEFTLSLERVMFYNPNVTWHQSWLASTAGDEAFADVYKIQGLRGIYVASQLRGNATQDMKQIQPGDLQTLITFDQGGLWTPIQGPATDEDGNAIAECAAFGKNTAKECSLHLSQQLSRKFPSTRSLPIMSSESAIGIVVASGNMGTHLKQHTNVFVSADAGLSWHQVLKGSYFYNLGDHGGIIVAIKYYKTEGPTNELVYSTNEGITWKTIKFYKEPMKVYGLLTEPGENSTTFTVFGTSAKTRGVDWVIITIDLRQAFARDCNPDDYKEWSPTDGSVGDKSWNVLTDGSIGKHRNCLLGRKQVFQRRMVNANCYNGHDDYSTLVKVENCGCDRSDYQCDFGFKRNTQGWSDNCIEDNEFAIDHYGVPGFCAPGLEFNLTRGYIKIRSDTCEGGYANMFEPQLVGCPLNQEKEFLLVAERSKIIRVNLANFSDVDNLPVQNVQNVITIEYDMADDCVFYGDVQENKIFKQCFDGTVSEVLVDNARSVEGKLEIIVRI